ncbi:helicase C-terminal domain-containing protein [Fructilactobacillus frigidiflavus]|uniref:helicase C-terminal domain-containing protein n=1 Tax=Fructilactobacillus frigidiflavus TaxID=3242688 RepID=UPI003756EE59
MDQNTTYAVVDMETTGTSIKQGAHIIQFSVRFVKNHQVVDAYSTYINDRVEISDEISKLTGITSETIKNAPTFDQVAATIYKKLKNTVFVAHNVNFDFPFLNTFLEKVGFPELEIPAIDTVSLTQIFFPALNSYRLSDLSSHFKITHKHPHSSASDAAATAVLLLKITDKIKTIPQTTLKSILELNLDLPQDTNDFIKSLYQSGNSKSHSLPKDLINVEGVVLKKPKTQNPTDHLKIPQFPTTKNKKLKLLEPNYSWRESQSKMMNLIYRNFNDSKKKPTNLLIEAPTGSGKTLGYLIPMAYLCRKGKSVVISTATIALQNQLQKTVNQVLNQQLGFGFSSVILKGKSHYLDLNRFLLSLIIDDGNKQSQFIKAKILVWLTETETGDLDELGLPKKAMITNQINYQAGFSDDNLDLGSYDFLNRQTEKLKNADLVITNHNYLYQNARKINETLNQKPYLVIDEAAKLSEVAYNAQQNHLWLGTIKQNSGRVRNDVFQTHAENLNDIFANDHHLLSETAKIIKLVDQIAEINSYLNNQFAKSFMKRLKAQEFVKGLRRDKLQDFINLNRLQFLKISQLNHDLTLILKNFNFQISNNSERWMPSDYESFLKFNEHLNQIIEFINQLTQIITDFSIDELADVILMKYGSDHDPNNVTLESFQLNSTNTLSKDIYKYFQPTIFTGAVLFTSKKSQFIYDQLDLNRNNTRMKRLKSDFDYDNQTQLLISTQTPMPEDVHNDAYVQYLADSVLDIYNSYPVPTLVLFNSLKLIEAVYQNICSREKHPYVLGSGISGSQDKIIRKFQETKNPIILGAKGFWEGVDFPDNYLKSVIIPRLPFAAPNNPLTKARTTYLRKEKKNPFTSYALPQTIMDLKQGMGRLLRNKNDYGTITILDNRLLTQRYGDQIMRSFNDNLNVFQGDLEELSTKNRAFFNAKKR